MPFFIDWTGQKKAFGMFVALAVQAAACDVETETDADDASEVTLRKIGHESVACHGKWPGENSCFWTFWSETDIVPDTIEVDLDIPAGHPGDKHHVATQVGPRQIDFLAVVHEGDFLNPGKNTVSYDVYWQRL